MDRVENLMWPRYADRRWRSRSGCPTPAPCPGQGLGQGSAHACPPRATATTHTVSSHRTNVLFRRSQAVNHAFPFSGSSTSRLVPLSFSSNNLTPQMGLNQQYVYVCVAKTCTCVRWSEYSHPGTSIAASCAHGRASENVEEQHRGYPYV